MTPDTWVVRRIGDVCRQVSVRSRAADLPILSVSKDLGIVLQSEKFKRRIASDDTSNYKRVRFGQFVYDPMLLWAGNVGRQQRVDEGIVSPAYTVFEIFGEVDGDYLECFLKHSEMLEVYKKISRGTNVRRQKALFSDFSSLPIPLPVLAEQRKIAAIILSVDNAIKITQSVVEQLLVVKKAMMAELLTRGLPGRHTRFKATDIGDIPDEWEVARVADCCVIRNDLRKPINQAEREKLRGPYPYYGPTKAMDSISEYRLDGTFALIGEDGDHFLKFNRWRMTQLISGQFNVNNHAHVIAGTARCRTEWFATFFQHRDITPRLTRQGANRYKLRKTTLEELQIPLPSVHEQMSICELLAAADAETASEEAWLGGLRNVRSALMSGLLTGELRATLDEATR